MKPAEVQPYSNMQHCTRGHLTIIFSKITSNEPTYIENYYKAQNVIQNAKKPIELHQTRL